MSTQLGKSALFWAFLSAFSGLTSAGTVETQQGKPIDTGFVFVDGKYIQIPYHVSVAGNVVSINGNFFSLDASDPNCDPVEIENALRIGNTLLINSGKSPLLLTKRWAADLLEHLLKNSHHPFSHDNFSTLISLDDLNLRIRNFSPSGEFSQRAATEVRDVRQNLQLEALTLIARRVSNNAGYFLTVVALLLVTVSVGQLLGTHRLLVNAESEQLDQSRINRAFQGNVHLIVGLAALDLIWTLVAAGAGEMVEMNPIGSRLIDSPWQLITMKLLSTAIAVGIFLGFRTHPLMRKANWWACTVYMLVGMRWIVLSGAMI